MKAQIYIIKPHSEKRILRGVFRQPRHPCSLIRAFAVAYSIGYCGVKYKDVWQICLSDHAESLAETGFLLFEKYPEDRLSHCAAHILQNNEHDYPPVGNHTFLEFSCVRTIIIESRQAKPTFLTYADSEGPV